VQLSLLILIVFVVLLWGVTSGRGVFRVLASLVSGTIGLAGFAGAAGLIWIGQKAHWTSDGPGMLLIMIAIPVSGAVGLVFSSVALKAMLSEPTPTPGSEPARQAGQGDASLGLPLAVRNRMMSWIVSGLLVLFVGSSVYDHRAGKPSHDARILVLHAYQPGGLASLDGQGVLKLWSIPGRGHRATRVLSVDASPSDLVVTPDAQVAFVRTNHHLLSVFDLTKAGHILHNVDHVSALCFEGGNSVLAIRDRNVIRIGSSVPNSLIPLQGLRPATALACRADSGEIAYVDETKVLHVFDERTGGDRFTIPLSMHAVRLMASPSFRRLLAIDAAGFLSVIDFDSRRELPLPRHHRSHHVAFLSDDQIVVGEISSARVDIPSMKSSPYFNLGQQVTALATLPSQLTTLMAFDKELYLARSQPENRGSLAATEHLRDPRF